MLDKATTFLAAIEDLLRYVAPGFVGAAVFLLSFPGFTFPSNIALVGAPYLLSVSGILLGVILNGCHVAVLEDAFCLLVLFFYWLRKKHRNSYKSPLEMLQRLEAQRGFRRTSSKQRAKEFQRRHDRLGASLTFLYCASYPGLVVTFYQWFWSPSVSHVALLTGIIFLLFALVCDATYTRRDIWAAGEFSE
jgi:hypothetical protein